MTPPWGHPLSLENNTLNFKYIGVCFDRQWGSSRFDGALRRPLCATRGPPRDPGHPRPANVRETATLNLQVRGARISLGGHDRSRIIALTYRFQLIQADASSRAFACDAGAKSSMKPRQCKQRQPKPHE